MRKPDSGPLRSRSGRILFSLSFGFVLLLVLDGIAARLFLDNRIRVENPVYHHDLRPNYSENVTWGRNRYRLVTNSLGFADRTNREVPLRSDLHRILFLGDSFTEGIGYPYEQTFVGMVDDRLRAKGYDVLNAGVVSYSPKLYYLKLQYLLERVGLKIDELVVMVDVSDPQDEIEYSGFEPCYDVPLMNRVKAYFAKNSVIGRQLLHLNGRPAAGAQAPPGRRGADAHDTAVRTGSPDVLVESFADVDRVLFHRNYWVERDGWTMDDAVLRRWARLGLTSCGDYMGKIVDLCHKHGVALTIGVYPWPDLVEQGLQSPQVVAWDGFCRHYGVPFFNCFPAFAEAGAPADVIAEYYIPDDVHWNARGHALVAELYLKFREEGGGGDESAP